MPGLFSNAPPPNAPSITTSLLLVKAISSILVNLQKRLWIITETTG